MPLYPRRVISATWCHGESRGASESPTLFISFAGSSHQRVFLSSTRQREEAMKGRGVHCAASKQTNKPKRLRLSKTTTICSLFQDSNKTNANTRNNNTAGSAKTKYSETKHSVNRVTTPSPSVHTPTSTPPPHCTGLGSRVHGETAPLPSGACSQPAPGVAAPPCNMDLCTDRLA